MKKSALLTLTALALVASGCAKRTPPIETAPPIETPPPTDVTSGDSPDVTDAELAASQAALVAAAGSDSVYFGTDEYLLDAAARATLTAQARWLIANPAQRAQIEGHCDERGTREYNIALGERRANAARDFLVSQGVAASRLTVISWGKEKPVSPGHDESSWAQNRRAVTMLVR
jgi:peptidoglycan-associated lipoprotein